MDGIGVVCGIGGGGEGGGVNLWRWKQGLGEGDDGGVGERVTEGRVAQDSLAWTSEVGTLHCLFNREQISKKIEAHQSFELGWGGFGGAAANVQEISNFVSELLTEGFVTEWSG